MIDSDNPFLTEPKNPNYLKRCRNHDYTWAGKYMVTLRKGELTPRLSEIKGDIASKVLSSPLAPHSELTVAGRCIEVAAKEWLQKFPQIRLARYAVMPDHVHLCINVINHLEPGLSRAIASLMGGATREMRRVTPGWDGSFFAKGFNDKIAFDIDQWERQLHYAADNPRRYLIKKLFIHPREKEVRDATLLSGGSIIRICENGFGERFAPQGREFEYMGSSRLLLIAPMEHRTQKEDLTYSRAQLMNSVAERIAAADWLGGSARFRAM